jgi:hypothetical protein
MPAARLGRNGHVGEIALEVEERRARNVAFEVSRASGRGIAEVIAAVGKSDVDAASVRGRMEL